VPAAPVAPSARPHPRRDESESGAGTRLDHGGAATCAQDRLREAKAKGELAAPTPPPVRRARLSPVPPPPPDPVEEIAREVAAAASCEGPLLVTVERGGEQSTAAFTVASAGPALDVFALDRIARSHRAVVLTASSAGGELRATLLLARSPAASRHVARRAPAESAWALLARLLGRSR
jgi:hypothetical protein